MWMQARTFDVNSSRVYNTRRKSPATRGGALLFFFPSFFLPFFPFFFFFLSFFYFYPSEDVNFFLIGSNLRPPRRKKYPQISRFSTPFLLFFYSFFFLSLFRREEKNFSLRKNRISKSSMILFSLGKFSLEKSPKNFFLPFLKRTLVP